MSNHIRMFFKKSRKVASLEDTINRLKIQLNIYQSSVSELREEVFNLKSKNSRDLIREILNIHPLVTDYNKDINGNEYENLTYLKGMADLSTNEVLIKELRKIIHESIEAIAMSNPKNDANEMLMTGNINACDVLLERLKQADVYLKQREEDKRLGISGNDD